MEIDIEKTTTTVYHLDLDEQAYQKLLELVKIGWDAMLAETPITEKSMAPYRHVLERLKNGV